MDSDLTEDQNRTRLLTCYVFTLSSYVISQDNPICLNVLRILTNARAHIESK